MPELCYKHPPLKMAGVTFVYADRGVNAEEAASLLSAVYPHRRAGEHARLSLSEQGLDELAFVAREPHIRLESSDEREAILVTSSSIAFRRYTPYGRWVDFRSAALRVLELLAPMKLGDTLRTQLRYVNHFDFKGTRELDWSQHFSIVPQWPNLGYNSHALTGMAQCVISYDEAPETFLRYTFRTLDEWTGEGLRFLLDLEGMIPGSLNLETLEVCHTRIEDFFKIALTEQAHEVHGRFYKEDGDGS